MKYKVISKLVFIITSVLLVISCTPTSTMQVENKTIPGLINPEVHAGNGIVSSSHPLASAAGLEIIKKGGNAVDAAVATAFALGVVEPNGSGIGGEGMMLIRLADSPDPVVIDFRSVSPKTPAELVQARKWKNSRLGGKSIAIPGMVAGAYRAWEKYGSGKVTFAECLEPAIRYASEGVVLNKAMAELLFTTLERIMDDPILSATFLTEDGLVKEEGQSYKMEQLAETLKIIAAGGADAFYKGTLAQQMAADIQAVGGWITAEDFANYPLRERKALKGSYRGFEVYGGPGPVGGIAVVNALQVLNQFDLKSYGFQSAEHVNLVKEAVKLGIGDLRLFAKDMDFHSIPYQQLLSLTYAKARASHIGPTTNINNDIIYAGLDTPGYVKQITRKIINTEAFQYQAADNSNYHPVRVKVAVGSDIVPSRSVTVAQNTFDKSSLKIPFSPNTTHLVSADRKGNLVTWTQTISSYWGARVVSPSTGVIFNNEMGNFRRRAKTGFKPYERMTTTISPTIITKNGKPYMCLGTPGGIKIVPAVVNVIINHIDFGLGLQEAIEAARFTSSYSKGKTVLHLEKPIPSATVETLRALGFTVDVGSVPMERKYGSIQAVLIDQKSGTVIGGADPRRGAAALGY